MVDTVAYSLVVIQHADGERFCLVHEVEQRGWWLPGGGVDAGQTFAEAAVREAAEEAGVDCELAGVLRVECDQLGEGRLRVVFFARPVDSSKPLKSVPDHHSRAARWVTVAEVQELAAKRPPPGFDGETAYLRGSEPLHWFQHVAAGGHVFPLQVLHLSLRGVVREWDGPGDPPRARPRTTSRLSLACVSADGDRIAVQADSGKLPSTDATGSRSLTMAAGRLRRSIGAGPVRGLVQARHVLDVRAGEGDDEAPAAHGANWEFILSASWESEEPPTGCRWTTSAACGRAVAVAHNNHDLRDAAKAWASDGLACTVFEKNQVQEVLNHFRGSANSGMHGGILVCTSTFPLRELPAGVAAVVFSKKAAADPRLREELVRAGAALVMQSAEPTRENFGGLLEALRLHGGCPDWNACHDTEVLKL